MLENYVSACNYITVWVRLPGRKGAQEPSPRDGWGRRVEVRIALYTLLYLLNTGVREGFDKSKIKK